MKKSFTRIFTVMLSLMLVFSVLPASAAYNVLDDNITVTLDKEEYTVGDIITATTNFPSDSYWVRVYTGSGFQYGNNIKVNGWHATRYGYGKTTYTYDTSTWDAGTYTLVAIVEDTGLSGWTITEEIVFTVKASESVIVTMDKSSYIAGEKINITATNFPAAGWFRVYKGSSIEGWTVNVMTDNVNSPGKSSVSFDTTGWETGDYTLVSFSGESGWKEAAEKITFHVTGFTTTATLNKESYFVGEKIVITTTGWTAEDHDYFRIFKGGNEVDYINDTPIENSYGNPGKSQYIIDTRGWEEGTYRFIAFENANWNLKQADILFTVSVNPNAKTAELNKTVYTQGETIVITTSNWVYEEGKDDEYSANGNADYIRIYHSLPVTNYDQNIQVQTYNDWNKTGNKTYTFDTTEWAPGEYRMIAFDEGKRAETDAFINDVTFTVLEADVNEIVGKSLSIDRDSYVQGEDIVISTTNWATVEKDYFKIYKSGIEHFDDAHIYTSYDNWAQQSYSVNTSGWAPGEYRIVAFNRGDYSKIIADITFTVKNKKTAVMNKESYVKGDIITVTTNWKEYTSDHDFIRIYKDLPVAGYNNSSQIVAQTYNNWGKAEYSFNTANWEAGEYRIIAFDKGKMDGSLPFILDKTFWVTDTAAYTVSSDGKTVTFNSDTTLKLSELSYAEEEGKLFNGWTLADGTPALGTSFTSGTVLTANYVDYNENDFVVSDTEIKTTDNPALRFIIEKKTSIENVISISEYGAVVLPTEILNAEAGKELAVGGSYTYNGKAYYAAAVKAENIYKELSDSVLYTACITGINGKNLMRSYTARGYIKYTDINGIERIVYSDTAAITPSATAEKDSLRAELLMHQTVKLGKINTAMESINVINANTDTLRNSIMNNTESSIGEYTGTTYYISANGGAYDDVTGTSESNSYSIEAYDDLSYDLQEGDKVLFKRGDIIRIPASIEAVSGVYYGAYGEGTEKPQIYGSEFNYAEKEWTNSGNNIWSINGNGGFGNRGDVGNVVFNLTTSGYKRSSKLALTGEYDFFYEVDSGNVKTLYIYCEGNPAEVYADIEICSNINILQPADSEFAGATIENLTFKYTGRHGVYGTSSNNITVRYCEFGYIGGSISSGVNKRLGNAVEFMGNSSNILVESNYIYQIYDSGVTHQGTGVIIDGFTVKDNLIEYCGMGAIEYWHDASSTVSNITYSGNILRYAGYGFGGEQRADKEMSACIMSNCKPNGCIYNNISNFVIENNIFEISRYQLLNVAHSAVVTTSPTLSGNTYIQSDGGVLGYYITNKNVLFDDSAEDIIKNTWGDTTAEIIVL